MLGGKTSCDNYRYVGSLENQKNGYPASQQRYDMSAYLGLQIKL